MRNTRLGPCAHDRGEPFWAGQARAGAVIRGGGATLEASWIARWVSVSWARLGDAVGEGGQVQTAQPTRDAPPSLAGLAAADTDQEEGMMCARMRCFMH